MTTRSLFFVRVGLGSALFVSFFLGHFWMVVLLGTLGLLLFPYYWEFLVGAICVEALFGGGATSRTWITALPIIAFCFFLSVEVARTFIREEILRVS